MMATYLSSSVHHDLIHKKDKLQQMAARLKAQFIGLDAVIDEITSLMLPWYLFPEAQRRPLVINSTLSQQFY